MIDRLDLWRSVKQTKGVSLLGVGNNPVRNFGTINLTIKFIENENLKFLDTFYIIENLNVEAIFGYEFLVNHNGIINTNRPPCIELSDDSQVKIPINYLHQEETDQSTLQVSGLFRLDDANYNYRPIKGCDLRKAPPRIVHTTALGNNELMTVLRNRRELIEGNSGHLNVSNVSVPKGGSPLNNSKQYGQLPQPHSICHNEVNRSVPVTPPPIKHVPLVKNNPFLSRSCNVNNLNASDHTTPKTVSFKDPVKYDVTEMTDQISHISLDEKATPVSERAPTPPPPKFSVQNIDTQSSKTSVKNSETKNKLFNPVEIIIPARCESTQIMPVPNEISQKYNGKTVVLDPENGIVNKGILMARSVNVINKNEIPIRLINLSNEDCVLPSKTMLASITEYHATTTQPPEVISDNIKRCNLVETKTSNTNDDDEWYKPLKLGAIEPLQKEKLVQRVKEYEVVFSKSETDIGECHLLPAKIELKVNTPIYTKQYPLSPKNLEKVKDEVKKLEKMNIIQKSTSAYNSPVIAVPKANGEVRMCLDFRKINLATIEMNTPIPSFEEASRLLAENKFFSSLDLQRGFNQMALHPDSYKYTAFSIQQNRYEFVRLPFGSRNSTFYFQQLMGLVLGDMPYTELMVYIDDILVFSKTFEEHLEKLEQIFIKLRDANLKLNLSKCHLCDTKIKFLGHIISAEGIYPDPKKSAAIRNFGRPTDRKSVRSFLGLTNFFRKFIENYSEIAHPLSELTSEKVKFVWTETEEMAFNKLKKCLISPQILRHPQSDRPFKLLVDASKKGCGAILIQSDEHGRDYAIAYHSRKLKDAETRYPSYDLELLSLVEAVEHFKSYLLSAPFTIFVDCCPLKHLMTQKDPTQKHWRWINRLSEFNFSIVHKKASDHTAVDCLSRDPRFEGERKVNNNTIDLLERIEVNREELNTWKNNIITELSLVCNSETSPGEYYARNDDSLYQVMSRIFTKNRENSSIFRNSVVKFIQTHKKYLEMSTNLPTDKLSKYIRDIKLGKRAENIELECLSSMLFIPIILIKDGNRSVYIPTMKSSIKTMPPHGVTIHLSFDVFGNYKWDNEDLNFQSDEKLDNVVKRVKSNRISYPCNDKEVNNPGSETKKTCDICAITKVEEISSPVYVPTISEVKACQQQDPYCQEWISYLINGVYPKIDRKEFQSKRDCITISDEGILTYTPTNQDHHGEENHPRIVLPLTLWKFVLMASHDRMAHIGRDKTLNLIKQRYYRPNMTTTVAKYIKSCTKCKNKIGQKIKKCCPVQRMPMVQERFQKWHLDFLGPLPRNKYNNRYILLCIDSFTRWPEIFAVEDQTAETVVMALLKLIARFGMMTDIVTDRGSAFHGKVVKGLYDKLGIKRNMTTPYHPASNGVVERQNQQVVNGIKTMIDPSQDDWEDKIPLMLMAFRATIHKFTNDSPYYCVYGKNMALPTQLLTESECQGRYAMGLRPEALGTEIALKLNGVRKEYLKVMEKHASKTQSYANRNREPVDLVVGQSVMLRRVAKKGQSKKLHCQWVPGFVITKKHSETNFTVQHLWKRRKFRVNAENIAAYDESFRVDLNTWYKEAEDIMENLKECEVTPPIHVETPFVNNEESDSESESDDAAGAIAPKPRVPGKRRNELELLLDEPSYIIGGKKIYEKDLVLPPARNLRPSKPPRKETIV